MSSNDLTATFCEYFDSRDIVQENLTLQVRKMHTALKVNKLIRERSTGCRLFVLNLPRPPNSRDGLVYYMEYLEALTDGLDRVLLVRGSGKEVITIY